METLKTVLIAAIVACITAGILVTVLPKDSSGNPTAPTFGTLAGPDIASPYLRWGGVAMYATRAESMNTASTTACSLVSPAATSTLVLGSGARFDVSSTTASAVKWYKSSQPATATTLLFGANIAANAQATIVATTTTDDFVIAPNQYINVIMSGGTGTFSPTGVCEAQFVAI